MRYSYLSIHTIKFGTQTAQCTDIKSIFLTVSNITNYGKGNPKRKWGKKNDSVKRRKKPSSGDADAGYVGDYNMLSMNAPN